jgi:hypothetical protein
MEIELPVSIRRQPNYTTCGPTSLHAVYEYYGDGITLPQVIEEVTQFPTGGTIGVHLSLHALRRGYEVDTWVFNVGHFDPTWFDGKTDLLAKIRARMAAKQRLGDPNVQQALEAAEEYLDRGGRVHWHDLTPRLVSGILGRGIPIIAGVNATYLWQCAREKDDQPDDVAGDAMGHFLVLAGYHSKERSVSIADPLQDNPLHGSRYYRVSAPRLAGAVFLGAATNDANFIAIKPKGWRRGKARTPRSSQ